MGNSDALLNRKAGSRTLAFLALLGSMAVMAFAMPSTSMAQENFCGVYLQPNLSQRCYSPGHPLFGVSLVTYEMPGCVTVANSSNELLQTWTCAPKGSSPGPAVELHFANDGIRRKGVIGNYGGSVGYFAGLVACYAEC
jgi:hypothetical protein